MTLLPAFLVSFLVILALPSLTLSQSLRRLRSCGSVASYFKSNALSRVGPYGLESDRRFPIIPFLAFAGDTGRGEAAAPTAGVDFSETNVQVEGVDEPDVIKTDGTQIYTLRSGTLFVADVLNDGAAGKVTGTLKLPLFPYEILIQGSKLLLFASDYGALKPTPTPKGGPPPIVQPLSRSTSEHVQEDLSSVERMEASPEEEKPAVTEPEPLVPGNGGLRPTSPIFPGPSIGVSIAVLYLVDVSGGKPRLLETLRMEGNVLSSREVDGVARIVLTSSVRSKLPFVFPNSTISEKQATIENKKVVENTMAEDWLPSYLLKIENCRDTRYRPCSKQSLISSCDRVYVPTGEFAGFDTLSVVTVPLTGSIEPQNSVSILSNGQDVYATTTSLYVTTGPYQFDFLSSVGDEADKFSTTLHKFALGNRGASYLASGKVKGSLLNQFSMHEFGGTFFVATTEGARWFQTRDLSKSMVTAFVVKRSALVKVGEVGNLGLGERIFAVRYIQSTAYVVTFRQIDPLYIIDLSKPTMLHVTGELKIPGFSTYLHLIAPGRILGVGQEATNEGRTTGAKVTLFDVSDVTKPSELSSWTLPGSSSEAEWDHRAFLYWAPESVAVLPVSVFSGGDDGFTGSIVLKISEDSITEQGRISHPKCCQGQIGNSGSPFTNFQFTPSIQRNLILGKLHLWSLSSELLQINNIKSLALESRVPLVIPN